MRFEEKTHVLRMLHIFLCNICQFAYLFQNVVTNTGWPTTFSASDGYWTDLTDLRFDGTKSGSGHYMWGSYIPFTNGTAYVLNYVSYNYIPLHAYK